MELRRRRIEAALRDSPWMKSELAKEAGECLEENADGFKARHIEAFIKQKKNQIW
jgi:hypothetical protein